MRWLTSRIMTIKNGDSSRSGGWEPGLGLESPWLRFVAIRTTFCVHRLPVLKIIAVVFLGYLLTKKL
jgi:hypothetical protein